MATESYANENNFPAKSELRDAVGAQFSLHQLPINCSGQLKLLKLNYRTKTCPVFDSVYDK